MKYLYLSLLLLCGTPTLLSQTAGELIRPLDFVTQLEDIYVDENGRGWSGGSCGVLLKTENDGQDWTQVESPVDADIQALACAGNDCSLNITIIFADEQVAKSTDNGLNWEIITLPESNAFPNRLNFFTESIGLAFSNNDEILRTTDAGANWSILEFPSYMATNLSQPTSSRAYFFNGDGKLYKTEDRGATWDTTAYTHPVTPRHLSFWSGQQGYMLDQNRHLYRTDDGGETFFLVNDNTGLPSNLMFMTALNDNSIRGVQVTDRVWESNDMGVSWSNYAIDLGDGTFVKRNFHERFGEFWLVSNLSAIFYSAEDFNNWESQIPAERLNAIDMAFTDAQTGFLTDRSGALFKSTDAGLTWSLFGQLPSPFNKFYVLPDGRLMVNGGANQPQVSADGGQTFTDYIPAAVTDQYPGEFFNRYALLPGGRIYLAAGDAAIYSDDNGSTWTGVDLSMLNVNPQNQLYFFDDNLGFMVDNSGGRFARTTDGGLTWEDMTDVSPTTQPLRRIYFTDTNNGILFGSSRSYRTTDGGDTWALDNSLPGAGDYEITANGEMYTAAFASGNNGTLHRSTDNAANWSDIDYVCAPFRGTAMTTDDRYLLAFGDGGVVVRYDLGMISPTRQQVRVVQDLTVFPNPAKDNINVDLTAFPSGGVVTLTDLQGRRLLERQISRGQGMLELDVNGLPAGLYILNLLGAGGQLATQRLVVQ